MNLAKVMAICFMLWFIFAIIAGSAEPAVGVAWNGSTSQSVLGYLTDFNNIRFQSSNVGTMSILGFNANYFQNLGNLLLWNFNIFNVSPYAMMIKYIVFMPITIFAFATIAYAFYSFGAWLVSLA